MIFESFEAYRRAGFSPRVAIIGAGPAGTTIARKLARANIPVVIFEAGKDDYDEVSQSFYAGKVIGDPYFDLDVARLRYQGGSSNHWAGWCRPLDALDFEPKPWVPDTGWPIRREAIEPYLEETREILDLVPFKPDRPLSEDIRWVQLIKSPAVRFLEKYGAELAASPNIALVRDTYVSDLQGNGTQITGAHIWSNNAPHGVFHAPFFVVATGGLENSRLLLWSNQRANGGVVPKAEALGRYWMEHPHYQAGNAIIPKPEAFETDDVQEAFFSPSWAAMERAKILNFGIRLIEQPYHGVKGLISSLACSAPGTAEWAANEIDNNLRCAAQLHVAWEMAPVAANRIELSKTERDRAGVPRIELHWQKSEQERRTVLESMRLFGDTLARTDLGRVRLADWLRDGESYPEDAELAGNHHMGGTRMGTDPAKSVVDADCKVHGMANLFVGGSSVFPTSGQANPTTTLVALACRLGEHLKTVVA